MSGEGGRPRVLVAHGINLAALDRRPAEHYGGLTLVALEARIAGFAEALGMEVAFAQTDFEGEYVQALHAAPDAADALVLNPGAWTHYAWAIRDALEVAGLPAVEVHLSDVAAREPFRRVSVIADVCVATVSGQGVEGYRTALRRLAEVLGA